MVKKKPVIETENFSFGPGQFISNTVNRYPCFHRKPSAYFHLFGTDRQFGTNDWHEISEIRISVKAPEID